MFFCISSRFIYVSTSNTELGYENFLKFCIKLQNVKFRSQTSKLVTKTTKCRYTFVNSNHRAWNVRNDKFVVCEV